jgi:hypothetical protein
MKDYKVMCMGDDCYSMVTIDSLTEKYPDGIPHPRALKCGKCLTPQDTRALKAFRKKQRKLIEKPIK